ncbi:hypothetical protein ACNQVK_01595 [Mycobacterium sp. 134]|uniref:DUF7461 family protein n=1 Tax=Mycobacterium sp. 134 TaxID=3400425 RepID=UPI003AAF1CAF
MEPAERLAEIAKLIEPYLNRHGNSEVGDLARSIRKLTVETFVSSGHEHEDWQLQKSAKGGWYCAACGEPVEQGPRRNGGVRPVVSDEIAALEAEVEHARAIAAISIGQPDRAENVAYREQMESKLRAARGRANGA